MDACGLNRTRATRVQPRWMSRNSLDPANHSVEHTRLPDAVERARVRIADDRAPAGPEDARELRKCAGEIRVLQHPGCEREVEARVREGQTLDVGADESGRSSRN